MFFDAGGNSPSHYEKFVNDRCRKYFIDLQIKGLMCECAFLKDKLDERDL